MPAKMINRRIKTRTLQKADWEEDFFFILFLFWVCGLADRFPFLPESLRRVAKKVTGATALCVSQCDATPRPSEAATAWNYFGAREPKILSTRRSPSFNWP